MSQNNNYYCDVNVTRFGKTTLVDRDNFEPAPSFLPTLGIQQFYRGSKLNLEARSE